MAGSSPRDLVNAGVRYFNPEAPRNEQGAIELGTKGYAETGTRKTATVVDARTHLGPGGLSSWKLDEHGFMFVQAAEPVTDFQNHAVVQAEWTPRVLDRVQKATGAAKVVWMGHIERNEKTRVYGRMAHSDFGPAFEPLFRRMLVARCGIPEKEANSCGICVVNYWGPIDRPAYKDPLGMLDGSTVDVEKDTVPFVTIGNIGYDRKPVSGKGDTGGVDPTKIPLASQDAPAFGPVYSPKHRWVFCPDMTPQEAVIFKQYDFRPDHGVRAAYHHSMQDKFHDDWKECPGRRSIECRVLLIFDSEANAPSSKL